MVVWRRTALPQRGGDAEPVEGQDPRGSGDHQPAPAPAAAAWGTARPGRRRAGWRGRGRRPRPPAPPGRRRPVTASPTGWAPGRSAAPPPGRGDGRGSGPPGAAQPAGRPPVELLAGHRPHHHRDEGGGVAAHPPDQAAADLLGQLVPARPPQQARGRRGGGRRRARAGQGGQVGSGRCPGSRTRPWRSAARCGAGRGPRGSRPPRAARRPASSPPPPRSWSRRPAATGRVTQVAGVVSAVARAPVVAPTAPLVRLALRMRGWASRAPARPSWCGAGCPGRGRAGGRPRRRLTSASHRPERHRLGPGLALATAGPGAAPRGPARRRAARPGRPRRPSPRRRRGPAPRGVGSVRAGPAAGRGSPRHHARGRRACLRRSGTAPVRTSGR